MDSLFIIYIFALFVLLTPNFILQFSYKQNNIVVAIIHALLFSIILFMTYKLFRNKQREPISIGTFEDNSEIYDVNIAKSNLGNLLLEKENKPKSEASYNNEIILTSPQSADISKLIENPPYDYTNFTNYDYQSMENRLKLLQSHQHSNEYFDLVPNFRETQHEKLCAADFGTNTPCCRQPNAYIPDEHVCDATKPYCTEYIDGVQWGKCVTNNPHPKPNLGRKKPSISPAPSTTSS